MLNLSPQERALESVLTPQGPAYQPSFDITSVVAGQHRLTDTEFLELYQHAPLYELGRWAFGVSQRLHPEDYRTYVIDRNINYTNICTARCTFCAFKRNDPKAADAYTLDQNHILGKIAELVSIGGTQILMQGGMNPELPISYYEDLLRAIRQHYPQVHIHAFSPPEFVEFARYFKMPVAEVIRRFKAAGLDTIPGGGGEIFSDRVRSRIGPGKCTGEEWLDVMAEAHRQGMGTSVTMLIGHIETVADRLDHLQRIRQRQDWALAHAPANYTAFITWTYQPDNTPLDRKRKWSPDSGKPYEFDNGRTVRLADAAEYLRTLALCRLYLDNIPNMQSSWVTMGPKVGQLAMFFGANDMGSVMMEENVVSATGTTFRLDAEMICRLIRDAGWIPAQRNQHYQVLRRWDGADAPDLHTRTASPHQIRQHAIRPQDTAAYKSGNFVPVQEHKTNAMSLPVL
ncbi:MAG: cyclic dehypoxanthinyl futalosine synthase [Phycisphaerae bacterium]